MQKEIMITKEQFFEFIKKNGDTADQVCCSTKHYLDYFDKYKATGKKAGWNWGAVLPMWPFYRRMYLIGFILVGISSFVNFFGDVFVNRFYINLLRGEDGAFFNFMASCMK